jgi:hypothetical protein
MAARWFGSSFSSPSSSIAVFCSGVVAVGVRWWMPAASAIYERNEVLPSKMYTNERMKVLKSITITLEPTRDPTLTPTPMTMRFVLPPFLSAGCSERTPFGSALVEGDRV